MSATPQFPTEPSPRAAIRSTPRATMRLQLHRDFTFADAASLVRYLADLGVSHLYASPILTARAGSMHGYDVTDPTRVNPELGGEDGLRGLVAALRRAGLGLIVDIVPNHMAVGGDDNAWWTDVLRHGPSSRFAGYFDIDWETPDPLLHGKVLAPFLGKPYGEALAQGDITAAAGPDGTPEIRCHGTPYPLRPDVPVPSLAELDTATQAGRDRLHALLEQQHYRLAWWSTAGDDINWRRFFDINGLAGLRIEVPDVFEATHAELFRLYADGLIDGFRVDHVDGLSDPPGYCRRLRARLTELEPRRPASAPRGPAWLVVEKILGAGERLPTDWGVDGTSGYDFMDSVSALQHDNNAEPALASLWASVSGRPPAFHAEETMARREILDRGFDAQLRATTAGLHGLARRDLATRDITAASIRRALVALLAQFPAYRTYGAGDRRSESDQAIFARALQAARDASPAALLPALDAVDRWLGGEPASSDPASSDQARAAVTKFQQLSAPIAAKAVEDTAFYRFGRLLSRNDVGFDAATLGTGAAAFHAACADRLAAFPDAMLTTATHDHKRGEDIRARLAVLSEIPAEWEARLRGWLRRVPDGAHPDTAPSDAAPPHAVRPHAAPTGGDAAMLFQMIVGAWPTELDPGDAGGVRSLAGRLRGWQEKALREAKLRTDWAAPDAAYESASQDFLQALMADQGFLREVADFVARIGPAGAVNGLAQTLLKLTAPGVPDLFQGTEFWDLSLVDPDNRRPVDFPARVAALHDESPAPALAGHWRDGRVKQAMIARALAARRARPALFARGAYRPVPASGEHAHRIVAFLREAEDATALVVVPRLIEPLLRRDGVQGGGAPGDGALGDGAPGDGAPGDGALGFDAAAWKDTRLELGAMEREGARAGAGTGTDGGHLVDAFTGQRIGSGAGTLDVSRLLAAFPVALFCSGAGQD